MQTEKHVFETASNHPFLVGLHSCFQTSSRLVQHQLNNLGPILRFGSLGSILCRHNFVSPQTCYCNYKLTEKAKKIIAYVMS